MIRKVYAKIFILFFISLLASNENLSSIKYLVCLEEVPTTDGLQTRCLFTKDFHDNITRRRKYHECDQDAGIKIDYRVYDNEFYNFIYSVRTDNYRAYIFFCILENILSECSGVYCRKKVNQYFGIFYGSVIGFFFNNSRRYIKKKHFTIEFRNGLRLNLVSALMYITKAMLVENYYTHDLHGIRKFLKHTRYAIACIHRINGFHIIHVNFSKIITLSFFNILKIISVILNKLQYSFVLVTGLLSNIEEELRLFQCNTYVQAIKLNPNEQSNDNANYIKLYNYNVFNGLIHKSIKRRNWITNILNYIWFALAPSISFDLTSLLSDK